MGFDSFQELDFLKQKYSIYKKKYGEGLFDKYALQERILACLKNKSSIQTFICKEYEFIENIIKNTKEKEVEQQEFQKQKLSEMIYAKYQKIEQYPKISFSKPIPFIMAHFIGAVTELYEVYYPPISTYFSSSSLWENFRDLFHSLKEFYNSNETGASEYIYTTLNKLSNEQDKNQKDLIKNQFIHSGITTLHLLKKNIYGILENIIDQGISDVHIEKDIRNMLSRIHQIIKDFSFQS